MGALPRPNLAAGPHRELVEALHVLHHRAGWPSLRRLAADTGVSHTTVSKAFSSPALPSWGTVELLVGAMGGDVDRFRTLWIAASTPADEADGPVVRIAGRTAELAVVRRHLDSGSGLLLITGEAGIGKTTLVGAAAASSDATVVVGHCLQLSREIPLLPIVDAMRVLLDVDDGQWMKDALAECPAFVRVSLARLLPELDPNATNPPDDPWGLERLLVSVSSVLRSLASSRPLALHLEDCHWADRGTLDLLTRLASTPATVPLVATWRTGDHETPDDHSAWLSKARWTPGVATVDLDALTLQETAEQLRLLTGVPADPGEAARIQARTQGLPLYTAQLARTPPGGELPPQLADLLDRRIGDIDTGAWTVARLLGIAQRRMGPRLLRTAGGLDPEATDDALRALADRGLIRRGSGDDAELSHPLFVDAVQRRLLPGEGARVHARLAEALALEPGIEPAEIADHWRAAGRPSQEMPHRVAAARLADERFALREALNAWLRVLELWDAGERAEALEMWQVLVPALKAAGEIFDADTLRGLARRAVALDLPDRQRAVALHWMAVSVIGDGRHEEGLALLDEALALLEEQPPSRELDELLADRVSTLVGVGRLDEARIELRRGLGVVDALEDQRSRRRWMALSMWVTMCSGDLDGAVALARDALTSEWPELDPLADIQLAATAIDVMLHTSTPATELEEMACDTLREIEAYNLTHSNGGVVMRANIAWAHLVQGDVAAAGEWVRPVTRSDPDPNTALAHYLLGAIELREGHVQAAADRCLAAAAQLLSHDQNWVDSIPWHAEVELWAGRFDSALGLLDEALEVTLPTQAVMTAALVRLHVRAHAARLDAAGAAEAERRRLVEQLRALVARARADPFDVAACDVSVPASSKTWRAELSRIEGADTMEGWVSAAVEWDRILRPHDASYCRWRAAQVALREGRGTIAARLLKRAATGARTHDPLRRAIEATNDGSAEAGLLSVRP